MTKRVAKRGDIIRGTCAHLCQAPGTATPTYIELPFSGPLLTGLAPTVFADGQAVAMGGSAGDNVPRHAPPPIRGRRELGTLVITSRSVLVSGRFAAADGDAATTCDEKGAPARVVAGACTVLVGA